MQQLLKKRFTILALLGVFLMPLATDAIDTIDTGYKINPSEEKTIEAHDVQKRVTNTSAGAYFIPTRTAQEWNDFLENASGILNIFDVVLCTNECDFVGQQVCNGNFLFTCGNYDPDVCLEFTVLPQEVCECGCANGACIDKVSTKVCSTCYNTCYNTCYDTCFNTCYLTCYSTCYSTCYLTCYSVCYDTCYTVRGIPYSCNPHPCNPYPCKPYSCNPYKCNPYNCFPYSCNPYSCNPYSCRPYPCNPYECNCSTVLECA